MTLHQLSEHYRLSQYIDALTNEIKVLTCEASGTNNPAPTSKPSDKHFDRTGDYAVKLTDTLKRLDEARIKSQQARANIEYYINVTVAEDDKLVSSAMYWRFVGLLPWHKVAAKLGTSEDSVKQMCYRYIRKH